MKKLLLSFFLSIVSVAALHADVLPINKFGGVNSDDSPLTLQAQSPDSQNVITDVGPGLQGRKGFIVLSTEPSLGLWSFGKSDGNRYLIDVSSIGSTTLLKATLGTAFTITVATLTQTVPTYGAQLGDKFYFINTVDGLKSWDGVAGSAPITVDASMKADKITTFKGRLAIANKTGNARVLYLSKYLDGTNFTPPTNPSDDDAALITVSGSLDEGVEGLCVYQDKLIVFKSNSFQGVYGSRRSNFLLRSFSDAVGLSGQESIQDCDGKLRWLSRGRKLYEFDGSTFHKISEDVDNLIGTIAQGDAASKSITQTTQGDWQNGSLSADLSATISPGDIVLSTYTGASFVDTVSTDFAAALSITHVDTTTVSGSVTLSTYTLAVSTLNAYSSITEFFGGVGFSYLAGTYQSFTTTTSFLVTNIRFNAKRVGSPGNGTIVIRSDNGGTVGNILASSTYDFNTITASTSGALVAIPFSGNTILYAATKYWIGFSTFGTSASNTVAFSGCDSGGRGCFSGCPGTNVCTNSGISALVGSSYSTSFDLNYFMEGQPVAYQPSGNYVSRTFDVGTTTASRTWSWNTFLASGSIPTSGTLTYETQTSSSPTGTFTSLVSVASGSAPTSTIQRYIRYKASFTSSDISTSPVLYGANLATTDLYATTGVFTSGASFIGSNITSWLPLTISDSHGSGTISYMFGSTGTANASLITNWQNISNGGVPTVALNSYAAVRASFTATSGTPPLALYDFSINWSEGSSIRLASIYPNQRYWLSVAVSSSNNNRIFVYDKKQQWQVYSGINASAMVMYNSKPYFGNSTGIYEAENGYNDNATSILSYYRTPTLIPSGVDLISNYQQIYMTTDNSDSTLATSFQLEGINTDYTLGSQIMNAQSGIQNFNPEFGMAEAQLGRYISFKWSITGTSFWRILNGNLYYKPGLRPE